MSSVIVAELCPSICWTTLTSAPLAMARLAAVCRSWCGCRSGTPIALAAALNAVRKVLTRNGWPLRMPAKTRSSGYFAELVSDPTAGRRLERAIRGKGAFRRFKDGLYEEHPELVSVWQAFRDTRAQRRVVEWLLEAELIDDASATEFLAEHPDPDIP